MQDNQINNIIFDFGGVLIDWNPRYLYRRIFNDETKMEWFLSNVCNRDWNIKLDSGYLFADGVRDLVAQYPEFEPEIRAYHLHWSEMISGEIAGSVAILRKAKTAGKKLFGLTNWSSETFGYALSRFDFLKEFDGIVVSGTEKTVKPNKEIYQILLTRYNLKPETCVFIDDVDANIATAIELGIHGIVFKNPEQLEQDLRKVIDPLI